MPEPDTGQRYQRVRWGCPCGQVCQYLNPLADEVDCAVCGQAAWRRDPLRRPHDFYINPRYGQACDCCGHQGTHRVRRDGEGRKPRCLQ